MKMIIAINNRSIEQKLTQRYYSKYEMYIAHSKDMVLKLAQSGQKAVIIIKEDIKGNIEFEELITKIKQLKNNVQIIVLVKELKNDLKEMLFAKEVFNIIEGKRFTFEELVELIEEPKMIVYKEAKFENKKSNVICITGGRCVGKTNTAITIGKLIAKNKRLKVLVLDLDFVYPTMDTYLNIYINYSLVDYINDLINNNVKLISNYESYDMNFQNLKYILNSKSIGMPNNDIIIKIIDSLSKIYDYIVVDTSSLMMNKIYTICNLKKYNVIHVIEPGKKALKNYKMDIVYLEKDVLLKSIFICNKRNIFKSLKKCKSEYKLKIYGYINYSIWTRLGLNHNNIRLNFNLKKVLKIIGIDKLQNIKLKIVEKILGYREEK